MSTSLVSLIGQATYLSFDIFDTAVLRKVQRPTDVFHLVAEVFAQRKGNLPLDYHQVRIDSEKRARVRAWSVRQHSETTLDEIYQCMAEEWPIISGLARELQQIEIEVEQTVCVRNEFIYSVFRQAQKMDKKCIFTSDIYLPREVIEELIWKTGYRDYYRMYLSSSFGVSKAAGGLYEIVLKDLSCDPGEIVHIGDNLDSDVKVARGYGLRSYHYEKCLDAASRSKKFRQDLAPALSSESAPVTRSIYAGTLINHFFADRTLREIVPEEFWYDFGYRYVGVLFLGFGFWLLDQAKENSLERLYFLSRDGYIMKKVYDLIASSIPDSPPSCYMYASRRALNIPAIVDLDEKTIDFLVSGTSTLQVGQFLQRLGFDSDSLREEIRGVGFPGENHLVVSGQDYGMLRQLYRNIEKDIMERSATEREFVIEYLQRIDFFAGQRLGIIDIGWHGSLQRSLGNLCKILGKDVDCTGLYLGTFSKAEEIHNEGHKMVAYLCHFGKPDCYHNVIKLCVEIFEFIHTAPHGSVISFTMANDRIVPVLEENDFEKRKSEKAEALQRGALDFIRDCLVVWNRYPFLRISKDLAVHSIHRVLRHPSYLEAERLGDLEHAEGFGDVYVRRHIARPPGLVESILMPSRVTKQYKKAFWPTGYKRRLFALERFLGFFQ
ncbi:conserved hypothetical protein [delta proteobacterium NaphS2]|nr:conserved hypothetical protein [delta proteobacterium NaphS2]